MEKLPSENEGKLDKEGKSDDEVEPEAEGKSEEEGNQEEEGKAAREGQLEGEGGPKEEGHPRDEDKSGKQGKSSEDEGQPPGEGKAEPQAKAASETRAAEKRLAEDYVPRKAKRKTDRGTTDDSPKNSREDLQDRHLSSEEMMRECADTSRAQEELRKKRNKNKMEECHWMQRDAQDTFTRGPNGVSGD
ncbi:PREDICTED: LOW QUALITY PROTEIN: transcription elongation factor A protein-like 6 [Dipodomys ordii]|uniref:LOW QUALITY PROTEIN: transcription elongation factor A protein-like 6 n=1 Tax=Dipodomys ordii TaxID=10020 RepID=A0A1S3GP02_DIPOR|nr:PREDICTED: LOW QUALITY PROTEIN: transcription elongation factor A protein-like 6 [Dipodomys ordii]